MAVSECRLSKVTENMSCAPGVKLHEQKQKIKQRFSVVKKLGQGTYGKVQLAVDKISGQSVAIKTIKKQKIETVKDLMRIQREIQIMSSIRHPHIIRIYEVFENREKIIIVMEYASGGELFEYLSVKSRLTDSDARKIFRQIATACYHCHKHNICHRDLKLENILLDINGNAKIADFGLSNLFGSDRCLSTFCGSPLYASPEIVQGQPYRGPEVDCWSLGVLLYTLVHGVMPFAAGSFHALVRQISAGDYHRPEHPSLASDLIDSLLEVNTQKRFNIEQVCAHWWLNSETATSCLNTAHRLSMADPVHLESLYSIIGDNARQADNTAWPAQVDPEPTSVSTSLYDDEISNKPSCESKRSQMKIPFEDYDEKNLKYWTGSCRPKTFHSTADQTFSSTAFSGGNRSINELYGTSSEMEAKKTRRSSLLGRQKSYEVNHYHHSSDKDDTTDRRQSDFEYQHREKIETPQSSLILTAEPISVNDFTNGYGELRVGDSPYQETSIINNHTLNKSNGHSILHLNQPEQANVDNNNVVQWSSHKQHPSDKHYNSNSPVKYLPVSGSRRSEVASFQSHYGVSLQEKYENKTISTSQNRARSTQSYGIEPKVANVVVERSRTYPSTRLTSVTTPFFLEDSDILQNNDNSSACSSVPTAMTTLNSSSSSYTSPPENEACRPITEFPEDNTGLQAGTWSGTRRNSHTYRMAAQWESILNADSVKPITLERPKRKLRESLSIQTKSTAVPEALRQTNSTVGSIRVTQARKMFEKSLNDSRSIAVPTTTKKKCIILKDAGGLIPIKDDAGRIHLYSNESTPKPSQPNSHLNGTLQAASRKGEVIEPRINLNEKKAVQLTEIPSLNENKNTKKGNVRKSGKYALKRQSNGIIKTSHKVSTQEKGSDDSADRLNGLKDQINSDDNLLIEAAHSAQKSRSIDKDDYENCVDYKEKTRADCLQVLKKSPRKMMMINSSETMREASTKTTNETPSCTERVMSSGNRDLITVQDDLQNVLSENAEREDWANIKHENLHLSSMHIAEFNDGTSDLHCRAKSLNISKTSSNSALLDNDQTAEEPRTSTRRASYARDFISRFLDRSAKTSSKHADSSTPVLKQYTRSKTDGLRLDQQLSTTALRSRATRIAAERRSSDLSSTTLDQAAGQHERLAQNNVTQSDNQIRASDLAVQCQSEYWSQMQRSHAADKASINTRKQNSSEYPEANTTENAPLASTAGHAYGSNDSSLLPPAPNNWRQTLDLVNGSTALPQRYVEPTPIGHGFAANNTLNRAFSSLDLDDNDMSETSSIGTTSTRLPCFDNDEVKDRIVRKSYMPRFNVHRRAREPSLSRSLMYLYEDPVMETYTRNPQYNSATAAVEPRPAMRPYGGSLHRRARSVTADLTTHARASTLRRRSSRESVANALGQCDEHLTMWSSPASAQLRRHTCYQLPIGPLGDSADTVASSTNISSAANAGRACRLSKISENVLKNLELAATAIQHVRRRRQQASDE